MKRIWQAIKKRWWVWVIVILIIVGFGRGRTNRPTVELATAAVTTIERTVLSSGELGVDTKAQLFAPLSGALLTVHVADGATVKRGDLLFTYDAASLYTALKTAESQLQTAQAAKRALDDAALTVTKRHSLQAAVDAAYSSKLQAQTAYDDNKTATTLAALDAAAAAYQQAVAAQEAAVAAQPKAADYTKAQAAIDAAQAGLWDAQGSSNKRTVVAPADGILAIGKDASGIVLGAGRTTIAGQLMATIITKDVLRFNAVVDETDLAVLTTGQSARIELDAYPGDSFAGTLTALPVLPELSSTGSKVYTVTVTLTQPLDSMRVGMQGQAAFVVETTKDVLSVPSVAVVTSGKKNEVVVEKDGAVKHQEVEIGVESNESVQIISGIVAGDKVVISDNLRDLTDDQQVTVK